MPKNNNVVQFLRLGDNGLEADNQLAKAVMVAMQQCKTWENASQEILAKAKQKARAVDREK